MSPRNAAHNSIRHEHVPVGAFGLSVPWKCTSLCAAVISEQMGGRTRGNTPHQIDCVVLWLKGIWQESWSLQFHTKTWKVRLVYQSLASQTSVANSLVEFADNKVNARWLTTVFLWSRQQSDDNWRYIRKRTTVIDLSRIKQARCIELQDAFRQWNEIVHNLTVPFCLLFFFS